MNRFKIDIPFIPPASSMFDQFSTLATIRCTKAMLSRNFTGSFRGSWSVDGDVPEYEIPRKIACRIAPLRVGRNAVSSSWYRKIFGEISMGEPFLASNTATSSLIWESTLNIHWNHSKMGAVVTTLISFDLLASGIRTTLHLSQRIV